MDGLLPSLLAALDGDDPEACLAAGRALVQAHGADPVDPMVERLLRLAAARAAEHQARRVLQEQLELLSAASFEAIIIHEGGVPTFVNHRASEMVGLPIEELLRPDTISRCVAPEDLPTAMARIRDKVEGAFVLTILHSDGSRRTTEFCTRQGTVGARPFRVVSLRDVTDRERTATLLRESEARLQRILSATFDSVVMSRDGIVVGVSGDDFFGHPPGSMVGRPVLEFVAPSGQAAVSRRISEQHVGTYETAVRSAAGETIPVEAISVMSTLDGEPVRAAGLRDLRASRAREAERRQLELQVERSQRLESLGVLAGGVAHDFNNLLIGVLGTAELLLETITDPDDRELVETIRIAGERAASLTKQLLGYARHAELRATEPVDVSALVRELRGLIEAALSKRAQVSLHLSADCVVSGDRSTLMQVLMNLLTNASDALGGASGRIDVTTRRLAEPDTRWDDALGATVGPGDWVLVEVRDAGLGMDDATRQRVFEPFFTTKPRGHGLGLGSCLGIVAAHRGAILVESAPGQGSTFSVLLPACDPPGEPVVAPPIPPPRPCRVLVVDDEPLVRIHVRRVLELRGFAVDEAPNGTSGLVAIAAREPDVVLLDLSMPDLDGVEVVRRMRIAGARAPVVLCSGDIGHAEECGLEPGMIQAILQKPFATRELVAVLERVREG